MAVLREEVLETIVDQHGNNNSCGSQIVWEENRRSKIQLTSKAENFTKFHFNFMIGVKSWDYTESKLKVTIIYIYLYGLRSTSMEIFQTSSLRSHLVCPTLHELKKSSYLPFYESNICSGKYFSYFINLQTTRRLTLTRKLSALHPFEMCMCTTSMRRKLRKFAQVKMHTALPRSI